MKFLEKFTLIVYSYIILFIAIILCLLIFNWVDLGTISNVLKIVTTQEPTSKITLAVSVIFILLSLKCIFFDSSSKEKIKEAQGILLKNESGKLLISKETLDNIVKSVVSGFESVKECIPKISVNEENEITITLQITVSENAVIKELASNLQNKVKEEVKAISDLEVKEVNIKVLNFSQENKEQD